MRIISGSKKGKKILLPDPEITRPLRDSVKENIFNVLKHTRNFQTNFQGIKVLDFFSGSGSFGLECISRGTKKVFFVENYFGVLPILKKNLASLKGVTNFEIIEIDINKENIKSFLKDKFDIIFMDPPYKNKNLEELLIEIQNSKLLNKNGIIILHRHKSEKGNFPPNFKIIEEKKYGISKIFFTTYLN